MKRETKLCANLNCGALLVDDEVDFRDGLCYDCWLKKLREAASE